MRDITFEIRSHIARERIQVTSSTDIGFGLQHVPEWSFTSASSSKIRRSEGYAVSTFRSLAHAVAQLTVANPRLYPLFRGQAVDHRNKAEASTLYPTFFRAPLGRSRLTGIAISKRWRYLGAAVKQLKQHLDPMPWQVPLAQHREYWWALLQHYELAATPLLDATQSLRMAATFALSDEHVWAKRPQGFVYVLGLPHAPACLSPMVDEQMVLIRLQSICPPEALRPHFQEGYMIGRWPLSLRRLKGDNAAYRLVGKYRLDNTSGGFWDSGFEPIPRDAVYPPSDAFSSTVREALANVVESRPA